MPKKQQWVFLSNVLLIGGLMLSIGATITIAVYIFLFQNIIGNIIHLILMIIVSIGIIMMLFSQKYNIMRDISYYGGKSFRLKMLGRCSGFNEGVPNNKYNDFDIDFQNILKGQTELCLYQTQSGVFEGKTVNRKIILDMRYWLRKKFYIYEYFMTLLQIELIKYNKLDKGSLHKPLFTAKNINSFNLIIYFGNKKKEYKLIYKNKTVLTYSFKKRIKQKSFYIQQKEIHIKDFYNFEY